MTREAIWLTVGLTAQACFFARFLWQWIVSEREGRSEIPVAFWYLSIVGGLLLLAYAVYRQDPVIILGQTLGTFVYVRNLMLLHRRGTGSRLPQVPAQSAVPSPHGRPHAQSTRISAG